MGDLEEMYSRMRLEEEEEGGFVVGSREVVPVANTHVLVGRFLTDKSINFQAMQNVLASIWRPREGVEIHDLGERIYSFVFFDLGLGRSNRACWCPKNLQETKTRIMCS